MAKKRLAKTITGVRRSATCSAEFTITEIAKSGRFRAASCTPTTFSTAFPAMATTTSPAKDSLMPIDSVAGFNAVTNQSLTKAAAAPLAPRTATVVPSVQRGGSWVASSPPMRKPGNVTTNRTSSTPAQMRLNVRSCAAAGA